MPRLQARPASAGSNLPADRRHSWRGTAAGYSLIGRTRSVRMASGSASGDGSVT